MTSRLLTASEAAELLRIHLVTLYSWVSEGRIPSVKLGRKRLFDSRELERWIEQHTVLEQQPMPTIEELLAGRRKGRVRGQESRPPRPEEP